ncbi:hypothetical protein BMG05_10450 [Mycobacterium malmoense]|nr:hypothetical protein BMG05_10450 [Mycobacterium malmoense]
MFGVVRGLAALVFDAVSAVTAPVADELWHKASRAARARSGAGLAEVDPEPELRCCANCGDQVEVGLSSRDWCDGCEDEDDRAPGDRPAQVGVEAIAEACGAGVFRSGGQTFETPGRPRITVSGPRVSDSDRLDHVIVLLEDIRNLLQHNDRQHIVGSALGLYECSIPTYGCHDDPRYTPSPNQ